VAGVALYLKASRARDRVGSVGLWALLVVLIAIWASGPWAPPPPSVTVLAITAISLWIFVPWASWVDKHRVFGSGG
jgi:hypothetical protein